MLKKDLEIQLTAANKLITDQREAIETAARANIAINKEMLSEKVEMRRLRKVLDRAITAVDSRTSTIRYIPSPYTNHNNYEHGGCEKDRDITTEPAPTEEEKFLNFLINNILNYQYKPENKDDFFRSGY